MTLRKKRMYYNALSGELAVEGAVYLSLDNGNDEDKRQHKYQTVTHSTQI
jgi:hypothetical protein